MNTVTDLRKYKLESLSITIKDAIAGLEGSWRRIGSLLSEARAEFPGDREFGRWCKAQEFGLSRDTLRVYRAAAEFAAERRSAANLSTDSLVLARTARMPPEKQQEILGRWEKDECLTRSAFEKEYVKATPKRGKAKVARIEKASKKAKSDLHADVAKLNEEVGELVSGLPLTYQQRVDKAIVKIQEAFQLMVDSRVAEKLAEREAILSERESKARDAELRWNKLITNFSTLMTYEEFKMIRGCLHPDRTDIDKSRLTEAFAIFIKLEQTVNKNIPIADLRKRGWAHVSPFYRGK